MSRKGKAGTITIITPDRSFVWSADKITTTIDETGVGVTVVLSRSSKPRVVRLAVDAQNDLFAEGE